MRRSFRFVVLAGILGSLVLASNEARADGPPTGARERSDRESGIVVMPQPQTPATAPETVLVKIDAPQPVDLEVQRGSEWDVVCRSPCNAALSTKENYRINGDGVRPSKPFRLQQGTETKLEVDPTASAGHAIAIVVTVTGSIGIAPILGVTAALAVAELFGLILICPLAQLDPKTTYGSCLVDVGAYVGQLYGKPYVWIPAVAGVVMVAGGGAWLASTPASQVTQATTGPQPSSPAAPLPITRVPDWRDAPKYPAAVSSPLMVVHF
jgi:hypothetical protein